MIGSRAFHFSFGKLPVPCSSRRFDKGYRVGLHAVKLTRETFIPGWLGNLHLRLAELAMDRNCFEDANILLEQAEAHYKTRVQAMVA